MKVRYYQQGEEKKIWDLFYNTIHKINIKHYTIEQVKAWAPNDTNLA